jgi:hypothetical protein
MKTIYWMDTLLETPKPIARKRTTNNKPPEKKTAPKTTTTTVLIIEKNGSPKTLALKELNEKDFYKKCGFKSSEGFKKQTEWKVRVGGQTLWVSVYAKSNGRANAENKYDFPPPIDTVLFFGNVLVSAQSMTTHMDTSQSVITQNIEKHYVSLTLELWKQIYAKLFGGFEDLQALELEDEDEEDELQLVPSHKKTKHGYLKDGFVVDSDSIEEEGDDDEEEDEEDDDSTSLVDKESVKELGSDLISMEDLGSELSEEEYEYGNVDAISVAVSGTDVNHDKKIEMMLHQNY